ncbi:hypothetical protein BCR35DRAFT_181742 [Leucosporidium creatinivorum]|uniref:TauD/TfdA-like domain-containing protein n=1 Tax=Leucosporidium creatinivorum TaxID=106004 RepID=A0A1Y2E5J4_9BASI|nr:hypothetical protein BCR35DRAFT_181742 [Leucosporidium creatinivorum]
MTVPLLTITPLDPTTIGTGVDFGAKVTNVDLNRLSDNEFQLIEQALYRYKVLIIPGQGGLEPEKQFAFVRRFDPSAPAEHGHNDAVKGNSLLNGIGNSISVHPEIKLVGGGKQSERFGGRVLKQADHTSYHKFPLTEKQRNEELLTRWHRWHMDAALYATSPPLVTSLLALSIPSGPPLTVVWDDGSGSVLPNVAAGSTGFLSGAKMYSCLDEEQRALVENSEVEYAPWPYQWNGASKGNSNGLGTYHEGKELALEDLPEWREEDVKTYPMLWTNPHTGEKSLQVHSVAVRRLHLRTSPSSPVSTISDLAEVRRILNSLQRPALQPENILCPAYELGDLVLFYNRGVYHSATDYPEAWEGEKGRRTMLQAHIAGSEEPK